MNRKCKDCEQEESENVQFSTNHEGTKNDYCEKCIQARIDRMIIDKPL